MEIKGKRVRSLDKRFSFIKPRTQVIIGLERIDRFRSALESIGFASPIRIGDKVLPSPNCGPVSEFNAEGKYKIHKNRPMETAYRMVEWHWVEWHGPDRVERSDWRDVPYQRYPRTFIPPPSIELQVSTTTDGKRLLVAPAIRFVKPKHQEIIHTINLFLELFGECTLFTENLGEIIKPPLRRLNWHILPEGEWPWSKLERELKPIIKNAEKGNQYLIRDRFRTVNGYGPEFVAVGRAGFEGYVVFAFPAKDIFVLESAYTANATYVFDKRWKILSQMTKAQILSKTLQKARFIHRVGWHKKIAHLLYSQI
jgi:hypothetical protein